MLEKGPIIESPIVGIKMRVTDGATHEVSAKMSISDFSECLIFRSIRLTLR